MILFVGIIIEGICYQKNGVKRAVFTPWAYWVQDAEEVFIVGKYDKYDKGGTELYYYLKDNNKMPVRITGNSPYHAMEQKLFEENIFLVYGNINEEMAEYLGVDVIDAEGWDIIAPIKRNMSVSERFCSPIWYIDIFDVEYGGYQDIDPNIRGVYYWEEAWLRHIWRGEYIIVTSDYENELIQWYMIKRGMEEPITLEGNTPEQYYTENVGGEEMECTFADKRTRFILNGDLSESGKCFSVVKWYKIDWANWYYNQLEY